MTEPLAPFAADLGPMHPVNRLGRAVQQLVSFAELHAGEVDGLIAELEALEQPDLAKRLGVYRDLHRQEIQQVAAELADVQAEIAEAARREERAGSPAPTPADDPTGADAYQRASAAPSAARSPSGASPSSAPPSGGSPPPAAPSAASSPKRARWLAGQARRAQPRPFSRRDFFRRST